MIDRIVGNRQIWYDACIDCKKKVTSDFGGGNVPGYYCERCQKNFETCKPTYNFRMLVYDHSESVYVSLLGEYPAEEIIGMTA